MGSEYIFYILDDAITLLPEAELRNLVENYVDATEFCSNGTREQNLLADAQSFQKASLSGNYYNGSAGRGENRAGNSIETLSWIVDCRRLLDSCAKHTAKRNAGEVCQVFEIVFGLLDHIDEGHDDVISFADEGGSCQMGFDWEKMLPAWFRALSATEEPAEYARRIDTVLNRHYAYGRTRMLAVARNVATPAQRQALPES
jgi:hypothetical protein